MLIITPNCKERLTTPLVRKNGELTSTSWDEALELAAGRFRSAGENLLVLAGGRLPNEDLFNLRRLADGAHGVAALYTHMAGGELTTQLGVTAGMDFGQMGKGTAILVVASNLHEEAPIWYLRVKQAAERGATLIVANARPTRLIGTLPTASATLTGRRLKPSWLSPMAADLPILRLLLQRVLFTAPRKP